MDVYAKIFFFYISYLQCRMVWYGPCVDTHNKNLVEQNHLRNWNNSCVLHFPGSGPGSNSTVCWYIPQIWWVQILPKETPLSVVDEKKLTFPNPLPTIPKGARLHCHSPRMPITIDDKQNICLQGAWSILHLKHTTDLGSQVYTHYLSDMQIKCSLLLIWYFSSLTMEQPHWLWSRNKRKKNKF